MRKRLAAERGEKVEFSMYGRSVAELVGKPQGSINVATNPFAWSLFDRYGAYRPAATAT